MGSFLFLVCMFECCLLCASFSCALETLLVGGNFTHVSFDSGATNSFVNSKVADNLANDMRQEM